MLNMQNHPPLSPPRPRRSRRGQTIAEFALTLPLLLLLMFGIIEFGRIFQSWVTIQNAARQAARYAVTGGYDQKMFPTNVSVPNGSAIYDGSDPSKQAAWNNGDTNKPSNLFDTTLYDANGNRNASFHGVPCPTNSPGGAAVNPGARDDLVLGPDAPNNSVFFQSHWNGIVCDPTNEDHQFMRRDLLRLVSMTRAAQQGVAGLIVGLRDVNGTFLPFQDMITIPGTGIEPASGPGKRPVTDSVNDQGSGWFNVFVCSSRAPLDKDGNPGLGARYTQDRVNDWQNRKCLIQEKDPPGFTGLNKPNGIGRNQYDAGGPDDFVTVIIFYNHPLLTPLASMGTAGSNATAGFLGTFIPLQASRTMVNESFRSVRPINLPSVQEGGGGGNVPTSTHTPIPPPTSSPTATQSPTSTLVPTWTSSPSPTAVPDCAALSLDPDITFTTNGEVQIRVVNTNTAPVLLSGAHVEWTPGIIPGMYLNDGRINGQQWWANQTFSASNLIDLGPSGPANWIKGNPPNYDNRKIAGGATTVVTLGFANGPLNMNGTFNDFDFARTIIYVNFYGDPDATNRCTLRFGNLPTATPRPSATPTNTGTPAACPNPNLYAFQFVTFADLGLVKFSFSNNSPDAVSIVGFSLTWRSLFSGQVLVHAYGKGASSPYSGGILMWDGNDTLTPTTGTYTDTSTWRLSPYWAAGLTDNVWFDFDGTLANLSTAGGQPSDFNGTTLTLSNGCVVTVQPSATVLPSVTRTPTNTVTPSRTNTPTSTLTQTPSKTNTPTTTLTPSNTNTRTPTYTPSNTFTPSNTPTPTRTYTPSNTPTRTNTPTITPTPSNTPTRTPTFTPSKTFTPTNTYTPSNTFTPTFTYTPSLTPSKTNTPTPSNTPTKTFTPSNTPTRTNTPTPSNTPTRTNTPTNTPTRTPTLTFTPSLTPSFTPTSTYTPSFTATSPATVTRTPTRDRKSVV